MTCRNSSNRGCSPGFPLNNTNGGQIANTIAYPRSQDIAETAHFLEFDGLIVPSARLACMNVILFCDRVPPEAMEAVTDHGLIDWANWIRTNVR
ncbi:RES family NAD+ phosphorylase [Mesorhizobium sp. M0174]|uniref:RES family NAD+ phosphorylase n=1 Tax=Mesorhizobium sp. M0174 TaxID=2956904 RepID=UPI003338C0C1